MRHFQTLSTASYDAANDTLLISDGSGDPCAPTLWFGREGMYLSVAAGYGPLEIALRPRFEEFTRVLARLQPVEGLQTTRQVGTGQAFLALGLQPNGVLLMRPTLVADATGHLAFNLSLSDSVRKALYDWLPVQPEQTAEA